MAPVSMVIVCLYELHIEVQVLLLYILPLIALITAIQGDAAAIIISNVKTRKTFKTLQTFS